MISIPSGVKVWLATGYTDMRKGFPGLSLMVQETLKRDPHSGHLFCFRGRQGGADQGDLARRPGCMPVYEEARARPLHLALGGRRHGGDHARSAWLSARRHRLANTAKNLASKLGGMSKTAGMAGANMIPSRHDRCGRSASW
jgi:hypothetical protein